MTRAPKDIPTIMSGAMVRATMRDIDPKTMTRRIAYMTRRGFDGRKNPLIDGPWTRVQPGDRLWIRENFRIDDGGVIPDGGGGQMDYVEPSIIFAADSPRQRGSGWTPSIHMPRIYSRLTLIVEAVKREPLQAISLADVIAEGVPATAPVGAFADLWRSLHGPKSWDENPEVVAISFRTIKANIDAEQVRKAA